MSDLRVIKTKSAIENAFIKLRAQKDLENIKVNELCKLAMINKTTFYNYYQDIYELTDEIENKNIRQCIYGFENFDQLIKNPEKFIHGIYDSFNANENIQIIFSNRWGYLVEKAQQSLLEIYKKEINTNEKKMCIVFLIQGAFYILFNFKSNPTEKLKMLSCVANDIISKRF